MVNILSFKFIKIEISDWNSFVHSNWLHSHHGGCGGQVFEGCCCHSRGHGCGKVGSVGSCNGHGEVAHAAAGCTVMQPVR